MGEANLGFAFPEHFEAIHFANSVGPELRAAEKAILGIDHAELGAIYLENHPLSEVLVATARFHHEPERTSRHGSVVAAVQTADLLSRQVRKNESSATPEPADDSWLTATGLGLAVPAVDR